ncbi:hypothetical protein CSOJ01_13033 [Colletotrichum sojae]|uniref:Uncharacterized protein n=1 Tax=Colletotrichum sojae TaxID=2175907 RepID=A0A8H6ITD6_9PEZI|nr:hypothetical protein CSOJ01_13033 [Colletotrichum sojae]
MVGVNCPTTPSPLGRHLPSTPQRNKARMKKKTSPGGETDNEKPSSIPKSLPGRSGNDPASLLASLGLVSPSLSFSKLRQVAIQAGCRAASMPDSRLGETEKGQGRGAALASFPVGAAIIERVNTKRKNEAETSACNQGAAVDAAEGSGN